MVAIYDCFPFFNELDVLQIRLAELAPHVDHFVLAEATRTHTGKPKPLFYQENRQRFAQYADKIIHIVVDDLPVDGDDWDRDHFQRHAVVRGLGLAQPNDVILLSDADEIPDPQIIAQFRRGISGAIHFIECDYYCYKLNLKVLDKWIGGCATRAIEFQHLPRHMQVFRQLRARQSRRLPAPLNAALSMARNKLRFGAFLRHHVHEHAGWHFTFVNDTGAIKYKIEAFAHQEFNTPELASLGSIERMIADRKSICGRAMQRVGDEQLPRTVRANRAAYAALLCDEAEAIAELAPRP